jgi:Tol biopolymer transport system component
LSFKERRLMPLDASPNGNEVVTLAQANDESPSDDLWLVNLSDGKTRPIVDSEADERQASFSPDGTWLAYGANPTGTQEVYVRRVDGSGTAVRVSTAGGQHPFWRRDGREVFFLSPTDDLVVVDTTALTRGGQPGRPVVLFRLMAVDASVRRRVPPYAVTADGQRFLVNVPTVPDPLTLIQLPGR